MKGDNAVAVPKQDIAAVAPYLQQSIDLNDHHW
jgi:hypothetical protein